MNLFKDTKVNDRYKGHTAVTADASGWRLGK